MATTSNGRQYWLWVTRPESYLVAGEENPGLKPGQQGSWTCHLDTREGDLVLLYRTSPKKDIAYLFEATSDADPITGWNNEWDGEPGCDFVSRLRLVNPLTLPEMRADPILAAEFSAMRSRFQQRSYRIEPSLWRHLLQLIEISNPDAGPEINRFMSR